MKTFIAVTPFMVRDDSGRPHHFAPSSGPISEETLRALAPLHGVAQHFLDEGVIREYEPEKDATVMESVGAKPDAMLYVQPVKKRKAMNQKLQDALNTISEALGATTSPIDAIVQWWHAVGLPPTTKLTDFTNEAELKRYAAFGYRADLSRGVAPQDLPHMIEICDRLGAAQSPNEAEAIITNAGKFPTDVAIYLVLTGCTQGFSSFLSPAIFCNPAIQTVPDAGKWAAAVWDGGAGPGLG